jgi:hypothetical protein
MRDPEDKEAFTEAMQALCAVYSVEPTYALLSGYWIGLKDMKLADVQMAVGKALRGGGKFMPRPGQMRESVAPPKLAAPYHAPWKGFEWQKQLEEKQDANEFRRLVESKKPEEP